MRSRIISVLCATWLSASAASAQSPDATCPDPAQRERAKAAWQKSPTRLQSVAKDAGVTEAAALAAASDRAVGASGAALAEIWKSLQAWPNAVTVIPKSDQVFEVHGRIPPGEPSKVSRYYNLAPESEGITGHLRPDLYRAIYAASLPGRDRTEYGVLFFDAAGALIFGVYVPSEHGGEDPAIRAAFEATRTAMRALPRACAELNPAAAGGE